jgi:hypothetical protein
MLVVIFILYVGTTVFPPCTTGDGATLTPSCTPSVEWERYLWQDGGFSPQDQRAFIFERYFSTRLYAKCQNAFRNSFPDCVVPNKSTIQRLVERFRETGSTGEKSRSGRPSVLSNDRLEDIRARLLQSPRKSFRKLSQETGTLMKLGLLTVLLSYGLRDFCITLYNRILLQKEYSLSHII